ncbi:MAG TPA: helix-turn-helix transcriptional regulator [Pseudobdellovibrionaceae bacterium]|jgi:DNA-binding XRE family transcriptional regulator|nr:helix-turn-helix transcriptional regulator [Pseudobdellovibrionaceae bacterium]
MTTKNAQRMFEKVNGPFSFATFMLGIRTTLDLSQVEMAKRLKISKAALCEIEKGRTLVSPKAAVRYAKKAGFSQTVALEACLQDQLRKANIRKRVRIEEAA